MQHTHLSKSCCFLLAALLGATLAVPAFVAGQEQELKTLKLVKTYQSEADVRTVYPDLSSKQAIRDEEESINFYDPQTKQLLKQMKKEKSKVLREEKQGEFTTVIEKTYEYKISPHQTFVMYTEYEGGYVKETGANPPSLYPQPRKRILYNHKGEVITELPPMLNYLEDSPDHNYFVAAYDGEGGTDAISFYDMNGNLLKKQEIHGNIWFEYSSNSEYVKVRRSFSTFPFDEAYLFTKTGDLVTKYEYKLQLRDNLFNFYVSEHAELFLFSMFNNAYLVSSEGQIIWQRPYLRIMDCRFNQERNDLIFYSLIDNKPLNESRKSIKIVSLSNGDLLEELTDIELVHLTANDLVIKREGTYHEYTIK